MNPGQAAEIATVVAEKIAPETTVAMRSLVGKMLGNGVGSDIAATVSHEMPGDMSAVFRKEWLEQSVKMLSRESGIPVQPNVAVDSLPALEFTSRSAALDAASQTTSTARDFATYKRMLGMTDADFTGKVLDVGSGSMQQLAYGTRRLNLPVQVTSVDPRFGLPLVRDLADAGNNVTQRLIGRLYPEKNTIAAFADKLPFADNSFDKTISMFSTSRYRHGTSQIFNDLAEMNRVTRPGGEVRVYPIWEEDVPRYQTIAKALNLKATFKPDLPAAIRDYETGRPAGVVDEMMIFHK